MKTLIQKMEEIQLLTDNMVKQASELDQMTSNLVNDFCKNEEGKEPTPEMEALNK